MSDRLRKLRPVQVAELFALGNLAFLAVDVYIAHSMIAFASWPTWVPVVFSLVAPVVLVAAMAAGRAIVPREGGPRWAGLAVGWASVIVGVAGLLLHLNDSFFEVMTLRRLVYSAPFVAPLAYTGLGLLVILNRTERPDSARWAWWVVWLAFGGVVGNFVLSLADHAQNGFFYWREWIAVVTAAIGVGFLGATLRWWRDATVRGVCWAVLGLQVVVGLLGFVWHGQAVLEGPGETLWEQVIYGAPLFAPLLFVNLATLAAIGLWALGRRAREA